EAHHRPFHRLAVEGDDAFDLDESIAAAAEPGHEEAGGDESAVPSGGTHRALLAFVLLCVPLGESRGRSKRGTYSRLRIPQRFFRFTHFFMEFSETGRRLESGRKIPYISGVGSVP